MPSIMVRQQQEHNRFMTWSILSAVWLALCFFVFSDLTQDFLQTVYEAKGFRGQFSPRYAAMDYQRIMFLISCSVPGLGWMWMSYKNHQ